MPSKRISTGYKPYRVVIVKKKSGHGRPGEFMEDFDDETKARTKADSAAKSDDNLSVYLQKIDADGYPSEITAIKRAGS